MKKIYITTLLLNFSLILAAQIQFGGALQLADFSEMNANLLDNNYPTIEDEVLSFSIISAKRKANTKWVSRFGFMFNHYNMKEATNTTLPPTEQRNKINLRTIGLLSGTGYNFINSKHISFGPSIDMLFLQNKLRLIENLPSDLTFGNILAGDPQTQEFRNFRLMFEGNFNLLFHFSPKKSKTQYGIGVTGGYRWDPFEPEWRYEETNVKLDIEGSQQSGFIFGIMFTIKGPDLMPQKPNIKQEKS
jgi:hypothetical protein